MNKHNYIANLLLPIFIGGFSAITYLIGANLSKPIDEGNVVEFTKFNQILDLIENKYVDSVNNVKSYMTTLEKKSKKKEKKESEGSGEEKPKKKLTSYFLFMKDTRPGVAKSNPAFSVTEISKELGRMWKELTDEEKAEWKEKAQNQ